MSDAGKGFEWCPITPWYKELINRFQEAQTARTNVVNLSFSHPRSYFPAQILRRREIRMCIATAKTQGWVIDTRRTPLVEFPNRYFLPPGWAPNILTDGTLEWCDTKPFEQEIALRGRETKSFFGYEFMDLSGFHIRGEIPAIILRRIERHKNGKWKQETREEIKRLLGEANQDEARAKNAEDRAEGVATKIEGPGDPTALLNSAQTMRERARQTKEKAALLERELGDIT